MYTKQQIIEEIKKIAKKLGATSLTSENFSRNSQISLSTVRYHFGTWNKAVKEAYLDPIPSGPVKKAEKIDDDKLLLDLMRLYSEFGKEPTEAIINANGEYSVRPYRRRWGSIQKAFLIAKNKYPNEFLKHKKQKDTSNAIVEDIKFIPHTLKSQKVMKKRTTFGEPINFRGLRFAPVNEQGVVYLFGIIAHELGYLIESIRTEYPDCEGKRCFDKKNNQWEHMRIEFEYRSSHFKEHGHNESDCDIIICWIHDWDKCPIEVLELRSTVQYLNNKG